MSELIRAATFGSIAGWTLGAQNQGRRSFVRQSFYDPIPPRMAQSPSLEAWLVWSDHLKAGGSAVGQSQALLKRWRYPLEGSAFGLARVGQGFSAPVSGSFDNPLSQGSAALGRAVYWGLVLHGKPEEAAERAFYDASIDHDGDGVWAAVAVARAIALLTPGRPVTTVVRDILEVLPSGSLLKAAIPQVLKTVGDPDGARAAKEGVESALKLADPNHAAYTGAWIVLGLAHGNGTFEASVLNAAGCGGDSGTATLVTGAISGFLSGDVPLAWTKHLGDAFVCGHGLRDVTPPTTLAAFSKQIVADYSAYAYIPPVPEPVVATEETEGAEQPAAEPVPAAIQVDAEKTKALLSQPLDGTTIELDGLSVFVKYLSGPVAVPEEAMKLTVGFTNTSESEATLLPTLTPPPGWEIAHKVSEFVLPAGGTSQFALVLKPKKAAPDTQWLTVETPQGEARFPLLPPPVWYWVGPMTNQEGTGFDKEYPAEKNIKLGAVFNGRSNMPVEWRPLRATGSRISLEPLFGTGPGTLYLYTEAVLPKAGRYRIVAACGVGVVCWIDDVKKFWYHDTHVPVPRAKEPYVGNFETEGTVKVLIKTFRNLDPAPDLWVYFLAEDGSLVTPTGFVPLE